MTRTHIWTTNRRLVKTNRFHNLWIVKILHYRISVLQILQNRCCKICKISRNLARPVLQILQDTPPNGPQPGFFGLANFANESPKEVSKKKRKREVLSSREDQTKVVEAWNLMASLAKLPKVVGLSDDRKQQLAARLEEHGLEGVLQAVTAIGDSAFCRGKNDRGWVASFDFLIQAKSCLKAIEGCYDNRTPIGRSGRPVILSEFDGKPIPQVAGFC
jgi:hypothetical protein